MIDHHCRMIDLDRQLLAAAAAESQGSPLVIQKNHPSLLLALDPVLALDLVLENLDPIPEDLDLADLNLALVPETLAVPVPEIQVSSTPCLDR